MDSGSKLLKRKHRDWITYPDASHAKLATAVTQQWSQQLTYQIEMKNHCDESDGG